MALLHQERLIGIEINVVNAMFAIAAQVEKQFKIDVTIEQGIRTAEYQHNLFIQGRTLINGVWTITNQSEVVTYADSGTSAHEYACACDCWCLKAGDTAMDYGNIYMASIIKNVADANPILRWGGYFPEPDRDHIEFANWEQVKAGTLTIQTYQASVV
jgi:hypothetical protein